MAVLGHLPKSKRDLGLAFGEHFLHDFPIKIFFNTLSLDKVSMSYLFSFPRYQIKFVIKFLIRQLMMSQTLFTQTKFIFTQPLKQWWTGRKRGEDKNTIN